MSSISPVHGAKSKVFHNNDECPVYKKAKKTTLIAGTTKNLCQKCARLNEPGIKLTPENRRNLYASAKYLDTDAKKKFGLQIPFEIYLQDPQVAFDNPTLGFDEAFYVNWEPGITDGPTSARFTVVDYNGDAETLGTPASWDSKSSQFLYNGLPINHSAAANKDHFQFHQVNVWVVLQRALMQVEDSLCLGRHVPWGFPGNRLIVVPHAGYGQNAFYDRESKSLQFYYFDSGGHRIYTCLSSDIINHEFGHAILDGIRPYFYESTLVETAAFHEFTGDLTAILMVMRNNKFRKGLAEGTNRDLKAASALNSIAEQFGSMIDEKPYLRTAVNNLTMEKVTDEDGPHTMSEVLTGTMFDILDRFARSYYRDRKKTWPQTLFFTIQKMQQLAFQALDFLPPVDATFNDYARAVLRSFELANPVDPHHYYNIILEAFHKRGILTGRQESELRKRVDLRNTTQPDIRYSVNDIGRSRATAYMFLNDNRRKFNIPANQDFEVVDLYDAQKCTADGRLLPKQTILQYLWKEEVLLKGKRFGEFDGELTAISCGGTIVFDENNVILFWAHKPGTQGDEDNGNRNGILRRNKFLEKLTHRIKSGHIGAIIGSGKGLLGTMIPQMTVERKSGRLDFRLAPHFKLNDDIENNFKSNRKWEISS